MPKVGVVIEVHFLDHGTINETEEETIEPTIVYGRVAKVSQEVVVLDTWHPSREDVDREKAKRHNELETCLIVRKAIVDWWELGRLKR
jgi:hypothetical protein